MRLFAVLAFAAALAAGSGCASNCTRDFLGQCTARFQWKDTSAGCNCFLLDLSPPTAQLWVHDGECTDSIDDFFNTTVTEEEPAELWAWTTNYTVVDNTLTFETAEPCGNGRRDGENATLTVSFNYYASSKAPKWCGSGCSRELKFYTNWDTCDTQQPQDFDNEVATSWRGSTSGSSRRNSASGRRNSASSRRNSASSTNDDGTRRGGCTSPLYDTVVPGNTTNSVCQIGQCCGSNFCQRERSWFDCGALEENAGWLVGPVCADSTCKPVYGEPGNTNGAGGKTVTLGSSLEFALDSVPAGGRLDITTIDVNNEANLPAPFVGGNVAVAFNVDREDSNGDPIHGYLPSGAYILVTVESDALAGDITVLRWDGAGWVSTLDDCAHDPPNLPNLEITYAAPVYTVPICHTSTFIVASAEDSKDKKDKKDAKDLKVSKKKGTPTKATKKAGSVTKAPKDVEKKAAKKGKAEIAIGVGVAGGAVFLAGAGVLIRRRSNKKSKKPVAGAPASNTEVAVVSV